MSRAPKQVGPSKRTKIRKELLDELISQEGIDELRERVKEIARIEAEKEKQEED